jgi:Fur family ferric uptake transcriptional regulator
VDVVDLGAQWRAYCASRALKSTRQRAILLDVVLGRAGHFSLDDVFSAAAAEMPAIGYATAYRTLKLFLEAGLIAPIDLGDGVSRYEVVRHEEHHDHIVCVGCGRVVEFVDAHIEELQVEVANRLGFELVAHRMDLRGRCRLGEHCPHRVASLGPSCVVQS